LEVGEGEVVHLRGPNGAGKTSMLKVLAGLLAVHSGSATVLGWDLLGDRRAVRREVGMLGHQSFLYEELTVEENLRFAVRAARGAVTGIRPALEQFGFAGRLASIPVGRCSAGQQRRASLAVLVARGARLWLLDEPHAGLDQDGRDLLDELLAGSRRPAAPSFSPRTSSSVPRPSPTGPSTWRVAAWSSRPECRDIRASQGSTRSCLRDAVLVAGKDLRIEIRSRSA